MTRGNFLRRIGLAVVAVACAPAVKLLEEPATLHEGWTTIQHGGFTFHMKQWPIFDRQQDGWPNQQ